MRLALKLLNTAATLNVYQEVTSVSVARGESLDLFFQLVDKDQKGLRYIPAQGATLNIVIPREVDIQATAYNQRTTADYSISRAGVNPFADDRSIFKLTLIPSETANLVSNSIRVTLTEGGAVKIATLNQALRVIDNQDE